MTMVNGCHWSLAIRDSTAATVLKIREIFWLKRVWLPKLSEPLKWIARSGSPSIHTRQEENHDPASSRFNWDILVQGGRTDTHDQHAKGSMIGAAFGCPDSLGFDHRDVLWIQTDLSSSTINKKSVARNGQ